MISVLTVNYDSAGDVLQLAQSLFSSASAEPIELIVTNNSPREHFRFPEHICRCTRVYPSHNVGYGRGVNAAAARADGDIMALLNPDVRMNVGTLAAAARYLRQNADVGVLLPRQVSGDGTILASSRRFYSWKSALYARCPLRDRIAHPAFFRDYLMLDADLSSPTDVDWGLGGAMLLRRSDFPDSRIFDGRFFLYFEDVDLCLRTWRAGRRVRYHPGFVCEHQHRRQSARLLSRQAWHHLCGVTKFIAKYRGLPSRPEFAPEAPA